MDEPLEQIFSDNTKVLDVIKLIVYAIGWFPLTASVSLHFAKNENGYLEFTSLVTFFSPENPKIIFQKNSFFCSIIFS